MPCVMNIIHAAGDGALARVEFHLDKLHLGADDAVIDVVSAPARRWRRDDARPRGLRRDVG